MSAPAVIRFPPPPPTRNDLSSEQRAKLIRTNNKLGQVLGSTPHVLDLSYIVPPVPHTELPAPPKTPTSSKNPFRSHIRKKSSPKVDMDAMRADARSPDSVASAASRRSTSSVRVKADELAWRTPYSVQRPPLLQLSVPATPSPSRKPKLDTIPGSPPFDELSGPPKPPTFNIPSDAAMRREKMRRVRKMLGDGVPHELVFPASPQESESESEEDSPLVETPTSTISMSREWLLVDVNMNKPLPTPRAHEVSKPLPIPIPAPAGPPPKKARRDRLYKERPKDKPSKGARKLESIAEGTADARIESITVVGVSASAGMDGRGKSRRFIKGDVPFDQIGTAWGGHMCGLGFGKLLKA